MGEQEVVAKTIQGYLNGDKVRQYLEGILKERTGQFITTLVSLSNLTPALANCEPKTLMMCGLKAVSLNLPLDNNLGFAYAIPYKNREKGIVEAQFQIGAKGFVQLALRTREYKSLNVLSIKEGELVKWDPLTETIDLNLIKDEDKRAKAATIGIVAYFELLNGFKKTLYWPIEKIRNHAKRFSKTFDQSKGQWRSGSVWASDEDAMGEKTLIKAVLTKWGPLTTEIMEAAKFDQSVIRQNEGGTEEPEYIDYKDEQKEPKEITYDIPPETLEDINNMCDILGISEADKSMRLGQCKGDLNLVNDYRKELLDKLGVRQQELSGDGNPPAEKTETELFGNDQKKGKGK